MTLRTVEPDEQRGAVVDFLVREQPHLVRPEVTLSFDDATAPERSVVGVDGPGGLVAVGVLARWVWSPPGHRSLRVVVAGGARGQGLGSALHDHLLGLVPTGTDTLRTTTFDDDPAAGAVAEHWGYRPLQLSVMSGIDVTAAEAPVPPAGVTVEVVERADHAGGDVAAMLDRSQTNPERHTSGPLTLEQLCSVQAGDRALLSVVRVDGRPAAICAAVHAGVEGYVAYTGVDPDHRGHGLAALAKRVVHHEARRRGVVRLATENEQHNDGIRRLNERLGYRVLFGTWRWTRPV